MSRISTLYATAPAIRHGFYEPTNWGEIRCTDCPHEAFNHDGRCNGVLGEDTPCYCITQREEIIFRWGARWRNAYTRRGRRRVA
jgi:hypothetical protein